jgi:hypothetical protein
MRRTLVGLVVLLGTIVVLVGCGGGQREIEPSGATLEGTVTYNNEKVLVAMIVLAGDKGGAQGFVGEDGRYQIENAPLGDVKVAVNVDAAKGQLMSKIMAKQKTPKIVNVPAKYADPNTSNLKTTINKGPNTYDIVLK